MQSSAADEMLKFALYVQMKYIFPFFYVKDSASSTSLQLGVCYDAFFQLSIALGPIFFQHTDRDISSVDLL